MQNQGLSEVTAAMCLGVPGEVVRLYPLQSDGLLEGEVDFGGVRRRVCLACVPEIAVGEYVIVHAGVAIARLDETAARQMLEDLKRLVDVDEELGPEPERVEG